MGRIKSHMGRIRIQIERVWKRTAPLGKDQKKEDPKESESGGHVERSTQSVEDNVISYVVICSRRAVGRGGGGGWARTRGGGWKVVLKIQEDWWRGPAECGRGGGGGDCCKWETEKGRGVTSGPTLPLFVLSCTKDCRLSEKTTFILGLRGGPCTCEHHTFRQLAGGSPV